MAINLHNHTRFSDGQFHIDEVVQACCNSSLELFGISDHYKNPLVNCLDHKSLKAYAQVLESFKVGKLKKGLEVWCMETIPYIDFDLVNRLDFVLFENAEDKLEELLEIKERYIEKPIVILAHPKISKLKNKELLPNFHYELNTHYSKRFLDRKFFGNHKHLTYTTGADMHRDLKRVDDLEKAVEFARAKGLKLLTKEDFS